MSVSRLFLVPAAVFVLCAPEAFAQDSGRLQGRVFVEGSRDPVVGAAVHMDPPEFQPDGVTEETLATPVDTTTDGSGNFTFIYLRSGLWRLDVTAEGYFNTVAKLEVTQSRTMRCTPTQERFCKQPLLFWMSPVKSGADLKVEAAFIDFDIPNVELERAKADLNAADAAYNAEDFRTAIDGYNTLLAKHPEMHVLLQDVGDAYRGAGEFEEAIASYERFLVAEPDNELVQRKIPRTRLLMGDMDAAADLVAAGGDASREDLYNLGEVEFQKNNPDVAADWYEKAVAADPTWEQPVFKLGMVALNRGDIEGAKARFQQVIDMAPDSESGAQAKAMLTALP